MSDDSYILPLIDAHDPACVGGKGASLSRLINAGFPVPPGFVITTSAFTAGRATHFTTIPPEVRDPLLAAFHALGDVEVAVRSSATAEDGDEMSMAGQYETILGVNSADRLLAAVQQCWRTADSDRVAHYLTQHAVDADSVKLALVVQQMVPADAAGVLFTANPRNGSRDEMLLEAAWGIGEAVVSGKVQPDVLIVDHARGCVNEAIIAEKNATFDATTGEMKPLFGPQRLAPVLSSAHVLALTTWGRRVEALYEAPQDIEWAIRNGQVFILQSRPITTLATAAARQACQRDTRTQLLAELDAGRGPWVVHNLGETAPRPTPLTWSVLQRFMSGDGGYGNLHRMIGFQPGPAIATEGFLRLIAGRVYMDLSLASEIFAPAFPFRYDLDLLRADPATMGGPPTVPVGSFGQLWRAERTTQQVTSTLQTLAEDLEARLEHTLIPEFTAWVTAEYARDVSQLDAAAWRELWHARDKRTMDEFAPLALLPSMLCVQASARLRIFLATHFWNDDPDSLLNTLAVGARLDATARSNAGLHALAQGTATLDGWLTEFGHRAPAEFELATARWSERPDTVSALAEHWRGHESPAAQHTRRKTESDTCREALSAQLSPALAREFNAYCEDLARWLPYREDGKYHLMRGYGLLRQLALSAGERLGIGADVFLLSLPEVERALTTGYAPLTVISERKLTHGAADAFSLPTILDREAVENFGAPPVRDPDQTHWTALPLAEGYAAGPVRILTAPDQIDPHERGFVLVCTTTDTGWTPLFANAAAVVVECGGSLSHGAVVAREMGVPAVTLPGATRLLQEGEHVTVDGRHGVVSRGDTTSAAAPLPPEIPPAQLPPPPGPGDLRAATLRRLGFIGWGTFLAAFFVLPLPWLHDPVMAGLDLFLWPLVATWGKAVTVGIIAAITASLTLIGQRLLNDHPRLVVAKQRAKALQLEAQPADVSPDRKTRLIAAAAPVQSRLTWAAFTPLAVLLGPMVISFMWLTERIDPAVWNPAPGSQAEIVALVDSDFRASVTLEIPESLELAAHSPATQTLLPIRETLQTLAQRWQATPPTPDLSWDLQAAAARTREAMLDDLQRFLAQPQPPQSLAWTVALPAESSAAFPVTLRFGVRESLTLTLTTGDAAPPALKSIQPDNGGPIQEFKVDYREVRVHGDRVFWAPFRTFGWSYDVGWLGVYLIVYLPLMGVWRLVLRLP